MHDQPSPRLTANRFVPTKHDNQKEASDHYDGIHDDHQDGCQGMFQVMVDNNVIGMKLQRHEKRVMNRAFYKDFQKLHQR